jgi:hypothetical protein
MKMATTSPVPIVDHLMGTAVYFKSSGERTGSDCADVVAKG